MVGDILPDIRRIVAISRMPSNNIGNISVVGGGGNCFSPCFIALAILIAAAGVEQMEAIRLMSAGGRSG